MCFAYFPDNLSDSILIGIALQNPKWPPRPTLISNYYYLDFSKQSEWGVEEWRAYAIYLEEAGKTLVRKLTETNNHLLNANKKLKRSKRPIESKSGTLLTGFRYSERTHKSRGRPKGAGAAARELAVLAINLKTQIEVDCGKSITNTKALAALKKQITRRNWTNKPKDSSILNAMSKIKKYS